jgi:hypothetical protein
MIGYLIVALLAGIVAAAAITMCPPLGSAEAEYPVAHPVRNCCSEYPETLRDILQHLPPADAMRAREDDDLITWAHEGHHFVNSRLSNPRMRGFYLLDSYSWRFPIPQRAKLIHVAEAVPKEHRGHVYRTYLLDAQKDWNDIALYPFDEALAYWTGAMVRQEIERPDRQETERYGVELLVYSMFATQEICRREPDDYPKQELQEFLDMLVARGRLICVEFDEQPHAEALGNLGRNVEVVDAKAE